MGAAGSGHQHATIWLLWLLLGLAAHASAAPALQLDAGFDYADLAYHVDLFEDPGGQLRMADISTPPRAYDFYPVRPAEVKLGSHSTFWFRFALSNPLTEPRTLILRVLPQDQASQVELYAGDAPVAAIKGGPQQFQLTVPAGGQVLYHLKLRPSELLGTELRLYSLDAFLRTQTERAWLAGAVNAMLALLVVGTVAAFTLSRDGIYLWLAAYGACALLFRQAYWGSFDGGFDSSTGWHIGLVAATLLLASFCSIRLALRFPVCPPQGFWRGWLNLLGFANLLAAALLFALPPPDDFTVATGLLLVSLLSTIGAALHGYLTVHRRLLLGFALVRLSVVLAVVLGALIGQSLPAHTYSLTSVALLVITLEMAGLLALLLLRTFRRQYTEARQQRLVAVAEAESRSRTEIIAELGHRIRTPVSGVLGMLEILQDTALSSTQRDYLGTIQRAGNELLNVVDELSDVSQLEDRGELQQTTFAPQALVAECVDGFRGLAGTRELELIADLAPELPTYVSGDPTRLRQILLQLLHHAISRSERGEVVLQVRRLPSRHWLRFRIDAASASAPALATGALGRRLHPAPAVGLRLAIAQQLVDTLGGRIGIDDQPDRRFQVWFELPLPAVGQTAETDTGQEILRGKQLLVVDDNATFCEVLRRQAGHWGMAVDTATSASAALARLRSQATLGRPVDALLLDGDMPELGDGAWLERLRSTGEAPPVIVLLTSGTQREDNLRLQRLGVRRVLFKPVNHTSLKMTLAEELDFQRPPDTPPAANHEPIRCLVAEDNVINSKVLVGMLDKLGVDCTAVVNGQQAVEACQRQDYDIVLMDCDMPIMDGWEAARRIRESQTNRNRPHTPIIALTANTPAELGERARQPALDAHLVKPIRLQELHALLERWTGKTIGGARSAG